MPLKRRQPPSADPLVSRPHRVSPALVLAGVAGACVLGAGLGLWARPDIGREPAPRRLTQAGPAPAARRQIEIRVDHPPATVAAAAAAAAPATPSQPEPSPVQAATP